MSTSHQRRMGGRMPEDADRRILQVPGSLKFEDITGTPITSPVSKTGVFALLVPDLAINLVIKGSAEFSIGDNGTLDGSVGKGAKVVPATQDFVYPCADVTTIYVKGTTGAVTFDFCFEMLI